MNTSFIYKRVSKKSVPVCQSNSSMSHETFFMGNFPLLFCSIKRRFYIASFSVTWNTVASMFQPYSSYSQCFSLRHGEKYEYMDHIMNCGRIFLAHLMSRPFWQIAIRIVQAYSPALLLNRTLWLSNNAEKIKEQKTTALLSLFDKYLWCGDASEQKEKPTHFCVGFFRSFFF